MHQDYRALWGNYNWYKTLSWNYNIMHQIKEMLKLRTEKKDCIIVNLKISRKIVTFVGMRAIEK